MYYCRHCDSDSHYFHKKSGMELCMMCGLKWDPLYASPEEVERMFPYQELKMENAPVSLDNESYPPSDYDENDNLLDKNGNIVIEKEIPRPNLIRLILGKLTKAIA